MSAQTSGNNSLTSLQKDVAPFYTSSEGSMSEIKEGDNDAVEDWITGWRLTTVLLGVTLVSFLMLLDTSIISTAIPIITHEFNSLVDVGWYGSAYQLASAALQPLTGRVYANFSAKWTYIGFFFIFEVGSLICGVATSSKMLIVGRAIAGMGTSGISNGTFTIIAGCVPMHKRPPIIGLIMGISQFGLVIGPLIGGAFTEYSTWRWCFYINLPVGALVAALLFFIRVPDETRKPAPRQVIGTLHRELDLIGFVLFAPFAIMLLLALQYGGNQYAWNSATVIGLFCGSAGTFIAFLVWEYFKGDKAMIPLSVMKQPVILSSCLVFGFLMSLLYTVTYYLPIFFQAAKGVSPMMSGVYLLPTILTQLFAAGLSGFLVQRLGYYLPFVVMGSVVNAIADGLLSTFLPSTSTGKWIGYQILAGFGQGIGLQMPVIAVQNNLPTSLIPVAMALTMFFSTFFGALFLSFANTILTNSLQTLVPKYAPAVSPATVIAAGATDLKSAVSAADLPGVLIAYAKSTDRVMYLCVGAACGCFLFSWGMGWKDIRAKNRTSAA
ncbi:major facilitator superfamily domain-containing protein [Aspergillus avenaceus]|uniref:Major facilitator superfamily domain-containing protein n=1 Tax=Aspergillus avenaceus TaxID=36643 RepID=A0A5N6TJM3_ASPAV|nr:major facilitator superfamily domain-containing protein [Aspergillus avenaceus]